MDAWVREPLHESREDLELTTMSRFAAVLVATVALLVLAGCTPGVPEVAANDQVAAADRTAEEQAPGEGPPPPAGPVVDFVGAANIAWESAPTTAPAGEVTISLTCEALPHNVVFEGLFGDDPVVECLGAGTETSDPVELPPGELTYYCSVPGHRSGMEGTLTVEG
jgi:plastocyanin